MHLILGNRDAIDLTNNSYAAFHICSIKGELAPTKQPQNQKQTPRVGLAVIYGSLDLGRGESLRKCLNTARAGLGVNIGT